MRVSAIPTILTAAVTNPENNPRFPSGAGGILMPRNSPGLLLRRRDAPRVRTYDSVFVKYFSGTFVNPVCQLFAIIYDLNISFHLMLAMSHPPCRVITSFDN